MGLLQQGFLPDVHFKNTLKVLISILTSSCLLDKTVLLLQVYKECTHLNNSYLVILQYKTNVRKLARQVRLSYQFRVWHQSNRNRHSALYLRAVLHAAYLSEALRLAVKRKSQ